MVVRDWDGEVQPNGMNRKTLFKKVFWGEMCIVFIHSTTSTHTSSRPRRTRWSCTCTTKGKIQIRNEEETFFCGKNDFSFPPNCIAGRSRRHRKPLYILRRKFETMEVCFLIPARSPSRRASTIPCTLKRPGSNRAFLNSPSWPGSTLGRQSTSSGPTREGPCRGRRSACTRRTQLGLK